VGWACATANVADNTFQLTGCEFQIPQNARRLINV
jgi:hypothetical protein